VDSVSASDIADCLRSDSAVLVSDSSIHSSSQFAYVVPLVSQVSIVGDTILRSVSSSVSSISPALHCATCLKSATVVPSVDTGPMPYIHIPSAFSHAASDVIKWIALLLSLVFSLSCPLIPLGDSTPLVFDPGGLLHFDILSALGLIF